MDDRKEYKFICPNCGNTQYKGINYKLEGRTYQPEKGYIGEELDYDRYFYGGETELYAECTKCHAIFETILDDDNNWIPDTSVTYEDLKISLKVSMEEQSEGG